MLTACMPDVFENMLQRKVLPPSTCQHEKCDAALCTKKATASRAYIGLRQGHCLCMFLGKSSASSLAQGACACRRGADRAAAEQGVPGAEPRLRLCGVLQPRLRAGRQEHALRAHLPVRLMPPHAALLTAPRSFSCTAQHGHAAAACVLHIQRILMHALRPAERAGIPAQM